MSRLFKTFWTDNKLIILISCLVFLGITVFVPTTIILISRIGEFGSYYTVSSPVAASGILGVCLVVGFWVNTGIMAPALAIFIIARTALGKARTRFAVIKATKTQFAFSNLLLYLIGMTAIYLITILIFLLLSVIFQADLSWLSFIEKIYSDGGQLIVVSVIAQFFISIFTTFFYWQTMFIAPQTRLFKKISSVGGIFILIGLYLGMHILQTILSFYFLVAFTENSTYLSLATNTIITALFITAYFYLITKEYEL